MLLQELTGGGVLLLEPLIFLFPWNGHAPEFILGKEQLEKAVGMAAGLDNIKVSAAGDIKDRHRRRHRLGRLFQHPLAETR